MNIIFFDGLNCHLAGVVNIAAALGIDYRAAFGSLWSETEFTYESEYNICTSKRAYDNLAALGLKGHKLDCGTLQQKSASFKMKKGELFLVGMDIFYIPWHPLFSHFHNRHFFFCQSENARSVLCFDPFFGANAVRLTLDDIHSAAFELTRFRRIAQAPLRYTVEEEAYAVLRGHTATLKSLLSRLDAFHSEGRPAASRLIQQVIAMVDNRRMFCHYIEQPAFEHIKKPAFSTGFFNAWEGVKSGLYKLLIVKDTASAFTEARTLIETLMRQEVEMARLVVDG